MMPNCAHMSEVELVHVLGEIHEVIHIINDDFYDIFLNSDQGGPVIDINNQLVAIKSWNILCTQDFP
jgi:hypothetical protein